MTAPRAAIDGPFVDLHAHSTASDGARTPTGLVEAAAGAGLYAVALTDHDTLAGVAEAVAEGDRLGVRIIPGVELSTVDEEREMHLLGLHVALDQVDAFERRLSVFRGARRERAEEMVRVLNSLGVPITLEAVLAHAGEGAIGRPHVARALVDGGWVRDTREAFDRYLGAGRPACIEKRRLPIGEGIALIHEHGGIAVLAHPGPEGRRDRVERLVRAGLDGLEVRHPGHNADDTQRLAALVEFYSLVPSGGSDWHGAVEGPRTLGSMGIPAAWLEQQDARVAAHRARPRIS